MSKFSKALEKIQKDRNSVNAVESGVSSEKASHVHHSAKTVKGTASYEGSAAPDYHESIPVMKSVDPNPRLVMQSFPNSPVAEQYRMLRTSLKTQLGKPSGNVVLVSSSINGEGKSVTSANLAMCLAECPDAKIALIDADLRRGKLAEYFGFDKKQDGLSNYLGNGHAIQDVMIRNYTDNLVIIPRGEVVKKPSELITSNKFTKMLAEMRRHFDYVILDAPPIMSAADAGILGRDSDGVLMVIQVGRTPKSVISHSAMLFKQAGVPMLGYVLTHVEYQSSDYRYYQEYYSYMDDSVNKKRSRFRIRRATLGIRNMESKFNRWWESKVLKDGPRENAPDDLDLPDEDEVEVHHVPRADHGEEKNAYESAVDETEKIKNPAPEKQKLSHMQWLRRQVEHRRARLKGERVQGTRVLRFSRRHRKYKNYSWLFLLATAAAIFGSYAAIRNSGFGPEDLDSKVTAMKRAVSDGNWRSGLAMQIGGLWNAFVSSSREFITTILIFFENLSGK